MESANNQEPNTASGSISSRSCSNQSTLREQLGFALVIVLFFVSGLSSLVYQVVWTRLLTLVFGSTTFATSTVLAVFMGGLALGSYLAGRVSDQLKRPFLWYGVLEGIIGLWALIVPLLFEAAVPLYKLVWQQIHLSLLPFSLLRFLMATIILIVPTTAMGATLPLISRFVTSSLDYVGRRIGTLYAANTMGAVLGAVLAGFVLLPTIGLKATTVLAAVANFLIMGTVLWLAPRIEKSMRPAFREESKEAKLHLSTPIRWTIVAFAMSGAIAMVYEVCWTRTLLMVIGSSTYAFSIMLSTFLVGIFLGSLICARFVDSAKEPILWFAILQILVCLCGILSMQNFNFLPWWNLVVNAQFPSNPAMSIAVRFLLAASILLSLAFCLGAIFPVVVKTATRELEAVGKSIGTLYSANTLGAIVGAFLAGFILVPWVGVEKTLIFSSLANLLIGVGLLALVKQIKPSIKILATVLSVVVVAWCVKEPDLWDRVIMLTSQTERRQLIFRRFAYSSFNDMRNWLHSHVAVLFWKDGASSTVGVAQYRASHTRSLVTNGHVDASDGHDMNTQILLSAYPLLFRPDASKVAVVGWGSGVTLGVASLFPVKSITAIELEPAVVKASSFFHHVNHRPEDSKLVHAEFNDGRNFLLATDEKFDVIISEPSNPWQAGVCNLFTKEYFDICKGRLNSGGIFSFWLQTVEIPPDNLRGILKSLHLVFPHILGLMADQGNLVVLASDKPLLVDILGLRRMISNPAIAHELSRVGIGSAESVFARTKLAPDGVDRIVYQAEPNTDDTNKLEYAVGKTYENRFFNQENTTLLEGSGGSPWKIIEMSGMSSSGKAATLSAIGKECLIAGRYFRALDWANASLAIAPSAEALRIAGIAYAEQGKTKEAQSSWQKALVLDPKHIETLQTRGMAKLQSRDFLGAREDFLHVLALEPNNQAALYHTAQTYAQEAVGAKIETDFYVRGGAVKNEANQSILKYLDRLTADQVFVRRHPDVLYMASVANVRLGQMLEGERLVRKYLDLDPKSISGARMLASMLYFRGQTAEASYWWYESLALSRQTADGLVQQGKELLSRGQEKKAVELFARAVEFWPGNAEVYSILVNLSQHNQQAKALVSSMHMLAPLYHGQLGG